MTYDSSKLLIKRLRVQQRYHAAYRLFGVAGALAEKWGHGYFYAYSYSQPERLQLSHSDYPRALVVGLKESLFHHEDLLPPDDLDTTIEYAKKTFNDINEVLEPRESVLVNAEITTLYPMDTWSRCLEAVKQKYYKSVDPPLATTVIDGVRFMYRYKRNKCTIDIHVSPFQKSELSAEFQWTEKPQGRPECAPEFSIMVLHSYTMREDSRAAEPKDALDDVYSVIRLASEEGVQHTHEMLEAILK